MELLQNEFAVVEVGVARGGSGDALVVRDRLSGETIRLDPLELEALARTSHAKLRELLVLPPPE